MRDGTEAGEDFIEAIVGEEEGIAAREEDVADFGVLFEGAEGGFPLGFEVLFADAGDDAGACAVAAVGGAAIGDEEEDAVGVAVDEAGDWHVRVLAAGVGEFFRGGPGFFDAGDDLAANGAVGVVAVDEVEVVRGDAHRELGACEEDTGAFLIGEVEACIEIGEGVDAVAELPTGIAPIFHCLGWPVSWGVGEEGGFEIGRAHEGVGQVGQVCRNRWIPQMRS